jgi:hypothetical protein
MVATGPAIGCGWFDWAGRRLRRSSATPMWTVRRDWPDGGHEFVRARSSEYAAQRQLVREHAYWRPGPVRPLLSVVTTSAHEFRLHGLHRRVCFAPDCPSAAVAAEAA